MSERYPLENEVPVVNEVPEDTYNPPKVKRKRLVSKTRGVVESYSAASHSLVASMAEPVLPSSSTTPSLAPSIAKPEEHGIVQYKIVRYRMERIKDLSLASGDEVSMLSEAEDGEILGFMMKTDNVNFVPEIAIFGDDDTYAVLNDDSVLDLIEDGSGMAPGDIADWGPISPDNAGNPDPVFFYVQRSKFTTETDVLGVDGSVFTVKFTPAVAVPYKAISVSIRNNSTSTGTILKARFVRRIYSLLDTELGDET